MIFDKLSIIPTEENFKKINPMLERPERIRSSATFKLSQPSPAILQSKPIEHSMMQRNPSSTADNNDIEAASKVIQKAYRGKAVRENVSIDTLVSGIVGTTIKKPSGLGSNLHFDGTPVGNIQEQMQKEAIYNRLSVVKGAQSGSVVGSKEGEQPKQAAQIAADNGISRNTAFINGSFFVHKNGLVDDQSNNLSELGRPVGETLTRLDYANIPEPWKKDYGHFMVGSQVGLSSGPLLSMNGEKLTDISNDERFKYRVPNTEGSTEENPLNKRAGALTHAGDNNERAAISIDRDSNLAMHTLTTQGERSKGVTMEKWQEITSIANPNNKSSLNLDGGGSVFMGVVNSKEEIVPISRGGNPVSEVRPVANIIVSKAKPDE